MKTRYTPKHDNTLSIMIIAFFALLVLAAIVTVLPAIVAGLSLDSLVDTLLGGLVTGAPALAVALLVAPKIDIRTVTLHITNHPYDDTLFEAWVTGGNSEQAFAQTGDQLSRFISKIHNYYVNGTFRDYYSLAPVTHVVEIERHHR